MTQGYRTLIVVPPLVRPEAYKTDDSRPDFEGVRLISPVDPVSIAAVLHDADIEVNIFDMGCWKDGLEERLTRVLFDFSPQVVVLVQSLLTFATAHDWNGDSLFGLARKQLPEVTTILTGAYACNNPGDAVSQGVCDIEIRGEVDFVLRDLLLKLVEGGEITSLPGVTAKLDQGKVVVSGTIPTVDCEQLPLPYYDLFSPEESLQYARLLEKGKIRYPARSSYYRDLCTSRGCVLNCSFCGVGYLRGMNNRYRRKSLDQVVAEIEQAFEQGIEEIHFIDDLFVSDEQQIYDLCNRLQRDGLKFPWFVSQGMPLWPLSYDALCAMVETGMYPLIAPFESGSDTVLKRVVGKLASVKHNQRVIEWCNRLGLELIGMYVVGMPGESRDDILSTIEFAEQHPEIDYNVFSIATPLTGTRMTQRLEKKAQLKNQDKVNKVVKRTVALFRTEEFSELELSLIRTFEWDRLNFSTKDRKQRYADMVGLNLEELDQMREHSQQVFRHYFPEYDGPLTYRALLQVVEQYEKMKPMLGER